MKLPFSPGRVGAHRFTQRFPIAEGARCPPRTLAYIFKNQWTVVLP
jgi:hypothetical protein